VAGQGQLTDRGRTADRAWAYYAVFGVGAIALYFSVPSDWKNLVQPILGLSAVLAMLLGVSRQPRAPRTPWLSMAFGTLLFVTGDTIWMIYENVLHKESPFPSVADVAYLAGYVPLIVGVFLLIRAREPGRDVANLLDSALITVGAGVGAWVFLIAPQIQANHDVIAQGVSAAYPLADLLMIAMTMRLLLGIGRRIPAYGMLTGALIALIAADVGFLFGTLRGWYQTGNVIDAGWLMSYVLWGAAALHPSRSRYGDAHHIDSPSRLTRLRLAALAVMALAAPAMLAVQGLRHRPLHLPVMVLSEMAVSLLVIARMAGLATALESAAFADQLTGLPNRRLLHDRLRQALARMARTREPVAVLFIDLGRFKSVNDQLGHAVGDDVLVELARRMKGVVRTQDTVARFGGDEFVVVCEGVDVAKITTVSDRLREALSRPITVGDEIVTLAVDVGIAMANPGCDDPDAILDQADRAMYRAKEETRAAHARTEPEVAQLT
jgi:diguanylate cyclase (GGDEF)-like protein